MSAPNTHQTGPEGAAALPTAAYERARAISRAGGASGTLSGARLVAHGVSWDDVAYTAALTRQQQQTRVAEHDALDPAEREYRADREHWVALQAAAAAEEPGSRERTRAALGLRPEQNPSRLQLAALEIQRLRELDAQYDTTHGRTPQHYERPYTLADAEADDGAEAAWWAIDGQDQQRGEVGEPSVAERISAARAAHGEVLYGLGDYGLSRDDLERHQATERATAITRRLPELSVYEVLDLASHAQNTRHVAAFGGPDDAVARADLRALATEADRRAAGQPEHSSAALLAEYVDRARLDLDPAIDREKWAIAGALHRALDDETRLAAQDAAWELLPDPADDAGWAALDDRDPAVAAAIEDAIEDAADPVAFSARALANTEAASGSDSEDAREARAEHEQTRWEQGGPDPALAWQPVTIPAARCEADPGPYEHGRPSAGLDDVDPAPTHDGPDRAELGELAARAADPWGHEDRVLAEHLADEAALNGPRLPDHEPEHEPEELEA